MVPVETFEQIIDPIEQFYLTLEHVWNAIGSDFDVTSCLPDLQELLMDADFAQPDQAAEATLIAMLYEIMDRVGRFSPWYRLPARAYGLITLRDPQTNRLRRMLAPEARLRWQAELSQLSGFFSSYSGLIKALLLVDHMMQDLPSQPCVTAQCKCTPPKVIQISPLVLQQTKIYCQACSEPFA